MEPDVYMTKNGVVCTVDGTTISLDPRTARPGLNFVSHAHSDHLPGRAGNNGNGRQRTPPARGTGRTMLSSRETRAIAGLRGVQMPGHVDRHPGVTLHDAGHILGARGLECGDLFYTGDICTRARAFLPGARIPRCRTLITECTFGLPEFVFPPEDEIIGRVNGIISDLYSRGIPVVLMGYQLGKAQTLTSLFGHWDPFYLHDSVKELNDLHRDLGVSLRDAMGHTEARRLGLLDKKPWVMVAPMMSEKSAFVQDVKSRYGALTVGFSGWAKSARFPFGRRCDYSIPMSDHCDFEELVDMVVGSGAQKVYTVHGFVDEFAGHLRRYGIDAQPLRAEVGGGGGAGKGRKQGQAGAPAP